MFGNLVMFYDSLKGYFSTFFRFFCYQRISNLHMKRVFLHSSQRGHQRRPHSWTFFKVQNYFKSYLAKIPLRSVGNIWWPKKLGLRPGKRQETQQKTWPTAWAARSAWATRRSKKSILPAQVFFMPWRVTGIIKNGADMPQDIILSIVFGIFC